MAAPSSNARALANFPNILKFSDDFEGSGYRALKTDVIVHMRDTPAGPDDVVDEIWLRRAFYTGGDGGSPDNGGTGATNLMKRNALEVGPGARANEWIAADLITSQAPGFGPGAISENCARYMNASKLNREDGQPVSHLIGAVTEIHDAEINPTRTSGAHEFDVTVVGTGNTDIYKARYANHWVARRANPSDTGIEVGQLVLTSVGEGVTVKSMMRVQEVGGTIEKYFDFPNFQVTGVGALSNVKLTTNRFSTDPENQSGLHLQIDGVEYGSVYVDNSGHTVITNAGGGSVRINNAGVAFEPLIDNVTKLGSATNRWAEAFVANATINTSDATMKTALRDFSDAELDAIGDVRLGIYQWLQSVAEKGEDGARRHAGALAQQVQDTFTAHGLDAAEYGLWCADPATEWVDEDQEIDVPVMEDFTEMVEDVKILGGHAVVTIVSKMVQRQVVDLIPVVDADGNPVMLPGRPPLYGRQRKDGAPEGSPDPADYEKVLTRAAIEPQPRMIAVPRTEVRPTIVTVERPVLDADGKPVMQLGLRYAQLSIMLHAWQRREMERLAARVSVLEKPA